MSRRLVLWTALLTASLAAPLWLLACGGDDQTENPVDAGDDGTLEGGDDGPFIDGGIWGDGSTGCLPFGAGCKSAGDCCSGTCTGGVCSYPPCVSVGGACGSNNQCCTFQCNSGKCDSLGGGCTTLGNACQQNGECCSGRCASGTCQPSGFCGQTGDICASGKDCCSGNCQLVNNGVGICGPAPSGPANCKMPDGTLCAGGGADGGSVYVDGGIPQCGGGCCSRACAPWGPTGILVCQPASGCHIVGDLCKKDDDCCGGPGLPYGGPQPVTCEGAADGGYGICRNPKGCKPNGDVCKLANTSCNASCDCCAGNCETQDTCHQDNMGVPRCSNSQCIDGGSDAGCASSADCCNGNPCVPNPVDGGQPPYVCYPGACVPACGGCTNTADCCPGETCVNGVCDPCTDGGGPPPGDGGCSNYGQLCTQNSDCCNGVPCTNGRCGQPIQ